MMDTKKSDEKYCFECGKIVKLKSEICPYCGCRQTPLILCERSRIVAAIFAFFLGGFGIHKFYLGRIKLGVLYILFCWTGVPTVVGFIEGIYYVCLSNEEFYFKYTNRK